MALIRKADRKIGFSFSQKDEIEFLCLSFSHKMCKFTKKVFVST